MYNIDHLRMLVETVNCGSFSASARKLGKVQSAVSQGIATLEDDLNVVLFDRSTRKPTLTADGDRILQFAKSILLQVEELEAATASIQRGEEASVGLALDNSLALPQMTAIYRAFEERYPSIALELISAASADIGDLVRKGRVTVGLVFCEITLSPDLDHCFIGNLPFLPVCAPSHPLAKVKGDLSLTDLIPHRQLQLRGETNPNFDHFPKMSTQAWYANDFHTISDLLLKGFGWAYVPAFIAESWLSQGRVAQLTLDVDHKAWSPPIELICSKRPTMGPAARWLHEELKSLLD
ncbi:LysR family transcriptional regulator [Rhodovibrionaceae bacterium A322]